MDSETRKLYLFQGSVFFIHLAYIAIFFGIVLINESYLRNFSTLIQFGVCLFIIYKCFPFNEKLEYFTRFDRSVIFYCATFLLMNVVAIEVYKSFVIPILTILQ